MQLRRCRAMGLEPLIAEAAARVKPLGSSRSCKCIGDRAWLLSATPAGRGARRARRRRSWALLQGELVLGAWTELDGLVADEDLDGPARAAT